MGNRRKILIFSTIFFFILFKFFSFGKNTLKFEFISLKDSLKSGINCISQDREGFLWFGSQDGLYRYDGYNITIYQHRDGDDSSLSDNHVRSIKEDSSGTLWIGTNNGGGRRR